MLTWRISNNAISVTMTIACAKLLTFSPIALVINHEPPFIAIKDGKEPNLIEGTYNKLISCSLGPIRVTSIQPHTVIIIEHGIPDTISIDRSTYTLSLQSSKHTTPWRIRFITNACLQSQIRKLSCLANAWIPSINQMRTGAKSQ